MINNPAGYKLRLLASFNDLVLLLLPHSVFLFAISQNLAGQKAVYYLVLYSMLILLPSALFSPLFYYSWLTSRIGGTFGKLLTGLNVLGEDGQKLNYKRSFFRHTTGYGFAGLLFGLGFFSIIRDEKKQGWHDKAVGSKVVIVKNSWPIALITLISLLILNAGFIGMTVINLFSGIYK